MRTPHRRSLLCLLVVTLLSACIGPRSADPAPIVRGPLATRVQHPFALTLLSMRPRRAAVQPEGSWGKALDLAYSSIHEVKAKGLNAVHFDGETARSSLRLRHGLGDGWDLESEVSVLFGTGGFLDAFIEGFHQLFGFPDAGRRLVDRNQYDMRLRYHGQSVYELTEDDYGFGDIPFVLTKELRAEKAGRPAVSLRVGLELPVGSKRRGFGNGELDFGVGVLLEKSSGRWTTTGALDVLAPGRPDSFRHADLSLETVYSIQAGFEYRWSDELSLLSQLALTTPFTRDFSMEEFSTEMLDFALGCAWQRESTTLHFAILEDLIAAQGPDFGVQVGASWGF